MKKTTNYAIGLWLLAAVLLFSLYYLVTNKDSIILEHLDATAPVPASPDPSTPAGPLNILILQKQVNDLQKEVNDMKAQQSQQAQQVQVAQAGLTSIPTT